MGHFVVSVVSELGVSLFSATFPSRKRAMDFVEWRIDELISQGATYVVMVDNAAQTEARYSASAIADGVFATIKSDWRNALVRAAA
jgi:hypothetical protein